MHIAGRLKGRGKLPADLLCFIRIAIHKKTVKSPKLRKNLRHLLLQLLLRQTNQLFLSGSGRLLQFQIFNVGISSVFLPRKEDIANDKHRVNHAQNKKQQCNRMTSIHINLIRKEEKQQRNAKRQQKLPYVLFPNSPAGLVILMRFHGSSPYISSLFPISSFQILYEEKILSFHFIIKDKRENRNTQVIYFTFYVPWERNCDIVTVKNGLKKKKENKM